MALIIPTSHSSFGDGTKTSGRFQRYVLAQVRSDADLDWIDRLRARLIKQEVKFNDVKEKKPLLQKDAALWSQIEKGIGQASIIVIDPGAYEPMVRDTLDSADIERAGSERKAVADACVSEVLSGTPIAYLPYAIFQQLPLSDEKSLTSLARFTPQGILKEIGPKLQHALVFAARAHAVFDVSSADSMTRTTDAFRSRRAARLILPEVLATTRYFDVENQKATDLLNSAVNAIAESFLRSVRRCRRDFRPAARHRV